jgi:hypothetical protein
LPKNPDELNDPEFLVMPEREVPKRVKVNYQKNYKTIIPFVAGVLVFALAVQSLAYISRAWSAKGEILGAATSAYDQLSGAGSSLASQNFDAAQNQFSSALTNLQSAQTKLDDFKALQLVVPQAKSADHVLRGASFLAAAGGRITSALSIFDDLKVSSKGVETVNVMTKLTENRQLLSSALGLLSQASGEFEVATNLPGDYASTLTKAQDQVTLLSGMLSDLVNLEDIYLGFFGTGPRVYLLVFQNYDEVRATGGFIGTYGVIKINDGKIQDLKIDSIYDLDGHIYNQVAAPGPFQPDIKKWGIRDANWFADFPTSASKLLQFFETGSQTADGVIALTPAMFEDLLNLTGPIAMPKYKVTLTADNFQEIVQYKTSVDYNKTSNNPKQMLADFAPMLLDRLSGLSKQQWLLLLQIMQNNINQKHLLLYSKDPNLEQKIQDLRVAGNILPADQDYLNIVNSNLGGTKTDLSITQKVNLQSKILSDGSVIDTLTIERHNTSSLLNRDFMRILVPMGSTLVSAHGMDAGNFRTSTAEGFTTDPDLAAWDEGQVNGHVFVRQESGKSEFSGWLGLAADETKTVTLVYMIPYKAKINFLNNHATYSLLFQKQNGIRPYEFGATLDAGDLKSSWESRNATSEGGRVKFDYTTGGDQYWAVILTK